MIRVLVADKNYLSRVGLELLLADLKGFQLLQSFTGDTNDINTRISALKPDLLIVDHASLGISSADLKTITKRNKSLKVLAITEPQRKDEMNNALSSGVN